MVVNPSFLESLNELNNLSTVDVKDPESDDFESARISAFEEPSADSGDAKVFGNLRKSVSNHGVLGDKKYVGKKVSRKNLDWSDDEDCSDVDSGMNIDTKQIDEDDDADGDDIVDDDEEDSNDIRNKKINDDDDDEDDLDDDDVDNEDDLDENNDNEINDDDDNDNDDEDVDDDDEDVDDDADSAMKINFNMIPDDLKSSLPKNLSHETNGDGIDTFSASTTDDNVTKGKATKNQLDILDKLLESRIRLQKSLQLCNQLPQHDVMDIFKEQAGPQVKESYESAQNLIKDLLSKLLKLQEVLCESNMETSSILTTGIVKNGDLGDEEIPSDTEDEDEDDSKTKSNSENSPGLDLPSKRKHTLTVLEYGEEVVKRHKALQPFQDSTIKKWHEKTQLASNAIRSKNFASFDKSVQQQIRQVLLDKEKLIKRTQLMRVPIKILGKRSIEETKNEDTVDLHLKDYDENIFDDGDFYHEMLKELIERKSDINSDDPIAAGRRWLELQKLRSKIKRKVDTRASKGRKVRYDVHPKLVNFMARQNVGTMSHQARNNLFDSLFGNKPQVSSY